MIFRDVVVPLASAYAVFLGVLAYAWRHPASSGAARRRGDARGLVLHTVRTTIGGFVAFLSIVLVFHVLIAGQRGALSSAVRGGGVLAVVAAPVFVAISLLVERRRRS